MNNKEDKKIIGWVTFWDGKMVEAYYAKPYYNLEQLEPAYRERLGEQSKRLEFRPITGFIFADEEREHVHEWESRGVVDTNPCVYTWKCKTCTAIRQSWDDGTEKIYEK